MRKSWLWLVAPVCGAAVAIACDNQGTVQLPYEDGGPEASTGSDGSTPFEAGTFVDSAAPLEGGADAEAGAAPPSRLLLSYNGSSSSELVAFGMQSQKVDGRMTYPDYLGTAYVGPTAPWLLEQSTDIVGRLDAQQPWVVDSSWSVAMNDFAADAGYAQPYSDPDAVLVGAGTTAYVLRYNRNLIAVLDTSKTVDGGAPTSTIDLSGEVQVAGDGYVQPVAGVYVAAQQRVYVLLANINRNDVTANGYDLLCSSTTPTVVAIDTTSSTLVDLNGSAAGHGWPLVGFSPVFGPGALAYDAMTGSSGRLLVLDAGCYGVAGDGGVGALTKREVESVDLSSGQATELLDLTSQAFPTSLTYIDAHHAIVQLDTAYAWDPTTTMLGAAIPNAPDAFVYDGVGNLLGVTSSYGADGGFEGYSVVSVPVAGGTVTMLGSNPFTLTNGFLGGVALWPAP
ncbi:MAG TPA: hypothetical protein VGM06_17845 [Polyangiaceae bacterium]|jgi:hypothetical protein